MLAASFCPDFDSPFDPKNLRTMASQLLPLGMSFSLSGVSTVRILIFETELIDKCVGSRIWVIMKGDKGKNALAVLSIIRH